MSTFTERRIPTSLITWATFNPKNCYKLLRYFGRVCHQVTAVGPDGFWLAIDNVERFRETVTDP